MPQEITKTSIVFPNNHEAITIFPPANAKAEEIIAALEIKPHKAVILIIGGADATDEKLKPRLIQLFGRGIARAAANADAIIIDGGTEAGVMAMMGQGVADRGFKSALVGVAPLSMVTYPGSEGAGETPLDPNHSHFVLVPGSSWGSETSVIFKLVSALRSSKTPAVALLAGGGAITKNETLQAVRQNLPLFVVEGSGGVADEIATAWKAKPELPDDPLMAEIIADGRIEFHRLSNSIKGAERLVIRELGGDNLLLQAWEHFADYDLNAVLQQQRFERIQRSILAIGILATALALTKQVFTPKDENGVDVIATWGFWWFTRYLLIILPILLTILITAANRFKQGHKWLLLRAGAEAMKREIYRYRARAGDYSEVLKAAPPSPTSPPPSPTATPEQVLSQRVEDITRRTMRTEVNTSALKPYNKDNGFPPYMNTAPGGDDGFSLLSPDRYVEVRLGDQLNYYKKKTIKLERQLKIIQWSIFIIGGLGTLLAAINQQVWIALTTALAAALTTYLSYQQTEASLMKYNQTATDLANVRAWWMALSAEDQEKQENIDTMVDHTERVLESELDGWVQQMQNALTELRKSQAPQIDEEKAAAAKVPTKSGGGESGGGGGDNGGNGGGNAGGENAVSKNADGNIAADENAGLGASGDNAGTGDAEVGNAADGSAGEDAVGDEQPPGGNPVD